LRWVLVLFFSFTRSHEEQENERRYAVGHGKGSLYGLARVIRRGVGNGGV